MTARDKPVLVLGHHRSGTTWVSSVLGAAAGYVSLPGELSNPTSGYRLGGQQLPPYVTMDALDRPTTDRALERLASRPHRSVFSKRGLAGWIPPPRWRRTPVFKDPLGSRIGAYLARTLDARAVVVVRHPAAVWVSLGRVGWDRSLPALDGGDEAMQQFTTLWSVVNGELSRTAATHGWPIVRHEDLAADPSSGFAALAGRLGVPYDEPMREEIARTTGATQTTPSGGVVHDLERDSAAVVDAWRDRITADELAQVMAGTAEVAAQWYEPSR